MSPVFLHLSFDEFCVVHINFFSLLSLRMFFMDKYVRQIHVMAVDCRISWEVPTYRNCGPKFILFATTNFTWEIVKLNQIVKLFYKLCTVIATAHKSMFNSTILLSKISSLKLESSVAGNGN